MSRNKVLLDATIAALSDEDLAALIQFFGRLVTGTELAKALAERTPAEAAAIDHFNAAELAARTIMSSPPSRRTRR